jgi:hypothetical protein
MLKGHVDEGCLKMMFGDKSFDLRFQRNATEKFGVGIFKLGTLMAIFRKFSKEYVGKLYARGRNEKNISTKTL